MSDKKNIGQIDLGVELSVAQMAEISLMMLLPIEHISTQFRISAQGPDKAQIWYPRPAGSDVTAKGSIDVDLQWALSEQFGKGNVTLITNSTDDFGYALVKKNPAP